MITKGQNGKTMPVTKHNLSGTLCRAFYRSKTVFKVSFNSTSSPERSGERSLSKGGWKGLLHTFSPRLSLRVRECPTDLIPRSHHAFDQRFAGLEYYDLQSNR